MTRAPVRRPSRAIGAAALLGAIAVLSSGCSAGAVLMWGPDGAAVKDATRDVIVAAQGGGENLPTCDRIELDTRNPSLWAGARAGEPEKDTDAYYAPFAEDGEPAWIINVEPGEEVVTDGATIPGYLAFRQTPDGLCLLALDWVTVGTVG